MVIIVGMLIVLGGILGGYALEHGQFMVLYQPAEYIIIGGAALGTLIVSTPVRVLKRLGAMLGEAFKGGTVSKDLYLNILKLMFDLFQVARKDGVLVLESHIEAPTKSAIFSKYKDVMDKHHLVQFLVDTLRLIILGGISPHDLESLMEADIDIHHADGALPAAQLQLTADALPGLGIVAAVLGICITMSAIGGPPEEIGHKVAAALVGTFLGILLCYGFFGPLAKNLEIMHEEEGMLFGAVKAGTVAFAKGCPPILAVEFARRSIPGDHRPTYQEMEKHVKTPKGAK